MWATLLDEGTYLASERTMYRLLVASGEVSERRDQLTHPPYERPELLAERPNQVWSWDVTKLLGPAKCSRSGGVAILNGYCVGTDEGAVPEIIEHGHTGYVVRSDDLDGLADVLALFVADADRAAALGKAGQRRVEVELNWDAVAARMAPILARRGGSGHGTSAS